MILINEDDYISKVKIARGIANQIADCKRRLNNPNELNVATNELVCLAFMLDVFNMVQVVLKIEHKIDLDSMREMRVDSKLEYKLQGTASIPHWIEFSTVSRNIPNEYLGISEHDE